MTANQEGSARRSKVKRFCGDCGTPLKSKQQYCHVCGAANDWGTDCTEPTIANASIEEVTQSESQPEQQDVDTERGTAYVTPLAVGVPADEKLTPAQIQQEHQIHQQSTEEGTEPSDEAETNKFPCPECQYSVFVNQLACSNCLLDLSWKEGRPVAISRAHDSDKPLWKTVWGVPDRDEWKEVGKKALNSGFKIIGGLVLAGLLMGIPHAVRSYNRQQQRQSAVRPGEFNIADIVPPTPREQLDRVHLSTEITGVSVGEAADMMTFFDEKTNATFVVPSSWQRMESNVENLHSDIQFESTDGEFTVSYWRKDLWNEMSSEERVGLDPSDVDGNFINQSALAEKMGVSWLMMIDPVSASTSGYGYGSLIWNAYSPDKSQISKLRYLWGWCYSSETWRYLESPRQVEAWLFHIDNGFLHTLHFKGAEYQLYDDFLSFVATFDFEEAAPR